MSKQYIGVSTRAYEVLLKKLINKILNFREQNQNYQICMEFNSDKPDAIFLARQYGQFDGAVYTKTLDIELSGECIFPEEQFNAIYKFLDEPTKGGI